MSEPAVPGGGEEPDAPGTEEEPIPPGMEETEAEATTAQPEVVSSAPEQAAAAEPVAADAAAAAASAAYPYYGQQQADGSYSYDPQYAGYEQYYGYYGYGSGTGKHPVPLRLLVTLKPVMNHCIHRPQTEARAKALNGHWVLHFAVAETSYVPQGCLN